MRRIGVHGTDSRAHLLVAKGEEPPNTCSRPLCQVHTQSLNQHHVGEVLCDQRAAWLCLAQLAHHQLDRPAQCRLVCSF
jgi:hypothetical protein